MAVTAIPNQPIKFWDTYDAAKLACEVFSKPFCLKYKPTDVIRFVVDGSARTGTQKYSNSDFSSGTTGWSQADGDGTTPTLWTDTTCESADAVTASTGDDTKWLYQTINLDETKCYQICVDLCSGAPAGYLDNIEIGYSADGGTTWVNLATQVGFNNNETYCFQLDIPVSGLTPIGVRFTGGGTNTIIVEGLTLTEYNCDIEITDCDCSTVSATISPTGYDTTTGQYIYEFDAATEGLSDGQYRLNESDLGCSSCFTIDSNLSNCAWLFKIGGNSGTTFGIDWSLFDANEYLTLRIENPEQRYAGYEDEESMIYRDSSFTNKLVYSNKNKVYELILPKIPEHIHDVFAILAAGSEYFSITIGSAEKRFRILPESYEISWTKNSDLATAKIKIVEYKQPSMINQNIASLS